MKSTHSVNEKVLRKRRGKPLHSEYKASVQAVACAQLHNLAVTDGHGIDPSAAAENILQTAKAALPEIKKLKLLQKVTKRF